MNFNVKGVIDKINGTALKIGPKGEILTCFKGYRKLSKNEIEQIYGVNGHIPEFNYREHKSKEQFRNVVDYFGASILSIFTYIID